MSLILRRAGDLVVFDKPAGMSVHNEKPSLLEQVTREFPKLHFVNRLDRETSGLVVAVTEPSAVESLTQALHGEASARKIYRAIVKSPRDPAAWFGKTGGTAQAFTFRDALSDRAEGRQNPLGHPRERIEAVTHGKVTGETEFFWDVEFTIETGRQHQIRKHAAFHQLPIVGDSRYGRDALNAKVTETYGVSRMMLHAWRLEFVWRGEPHSFEAPLPEEFAKLVAPTSVR
ncbi:MAG: RNA pseudouridine synthase [Bdellovibrionaceae bacterium]|nr:RNA pseudouridine synthase [Pseudobdellovibrionaceae bacterium]